MQMDDSDENGRLWMQMDGGGKNWIRYMKTDNSG